MRSAVRTTSLAARFSVALGVMLLPLVAAAAVSLSAFRASVAEIEEFHREVVAESESIDRLRTLLVDAEETAEEYVDQGDRSAARRFLALSRRIDESFAEMAKLDTPTERRLAAEARASWQRAFEVAAGPIPATGAPGSDALDDFHDPIDNAGGLVADLYSLNGTEMGRQVTLLRAQERGQLLGSLVVLVAGSIGAVLLASRLRRSITAQLQSLQEAAAEFAADNLAHRVAFEGDDELGKVAGAFNRMASTVGRQRSALVATARRQQQAVARLERSERSKEESLSLVRATLESTGDGILVVDRDGNIVDFNRRFVEMWRVPKSLMQSKDIDEALGHVLDHLMDPDAFLAKVHKLHQQPEVSSSDTVVFKDGRVFERWSQPQMMSGKPVGRVWTFRDVSEQKRLEVELRQSQKMEAIGQLAGGVAHDFNNLLSVIQNYAVFVGETLDDDDPRREDVEEIRIAAGRAGSLTRQLLTFSRKEVVQPVVLNPNAAVDEVAKLLRRTLKEHIELDLKVGPEVRLIEIDPGSLHQVVMNLAINASDAMPDGGTLTVETRNVTFAGERQLRTGALPLGDYVCIGVSDTGCGMGPDTLERMFEPFFTTKPRGAGTGLGLATVYGIVEQAGGNIHVDSQPGLGTTFEVYLPAVPSEISTDAPRRDLTSPGRGQTVLVVEDEDGVRRVVCRILSTNGYTVMAAASGSEALDLLIRQGRDVDLVLTDVIMPGISGRELADRIGELLPDMPVAYMSGYEDLVAPGGGVHGRNYLLKPFSGDQLLEMIELALEGVASVR